MKKIATIVAIIIAVFWVFLATPTYYCDICGRPVYGPYTYIILDSGETVAVCEYCDD